MYALEIPLIDVNNNIYCCVHPMIDTSEMYNHTFIKKLTSLENKSQTAER